MILGDFLQQLADDGCPVFESHDAARDLGKPADLTSVRLETLARQRRKSDPGVPPEWDPGVAHSIAGALCRLAQFTVFREIPEEAIITEWDEMRPRIMIAEPSTSQIWSADVVLAFLPDLFRIARAITANDPLMKPIRELATAWPLSGIGVDGWSRTEADFSTILSHPTLASLAVDRILATRDRELAAMPLFRARIDRAVGDYSANLAPWLADVA